MHRNSRTKLVSANKLTIRNYLCDRDRCETETNTYYNDKDHYRRAVFIQPE